MAQSKIPDFKNIVSSKTLFYFLIIIIIFLMFSLIKEFNTKIYLKKELNRIQEEIKLLEQVNSNYLEEIDKTKTEYFKEKQARLKMGLKKPGEEVIVIVSEEDKNLNQEKGFINRQKSNIKIWWNLFFGK